MMQRFLGQVVAEAACTVVVAVVLHTLADRMVRRYAKNVIRKISK